MVSNTSPDNVISEGIGWSTFNVFESRYGESVETLVEFITEMKKRLSSG